MFLLESAVARELRDFIFYFVFRGGKLRENSLFSFFLNENICVVFIRLISFRSFIARRKLKDF